MMKRRAAFLRACLLMGVLFAPSLQAQTAKPIVITFSHVVADDTPKGKAALRFKDLAEQATQGRVFVQIYPNSQLYKDKEELEALQLGAVQMLAPSLAKFAPLGVGEFEVFDIPYMFPSKTALRKITDGKIGAELLAKLEPKGIKGLAYWDNGFKLMSAKRPIRLPDDVKGLKLRIQSSRVLDAQMRALGALPQVLAFSEVYQALQTGVVDGTENPPSNMITQRMHEVQPYATLTDHGYLGYAVIVNKRFWDSLPSDLRAVLETALRDATRYGNEIAQQENDAAITAMKAAGTTEFHAQTPEERKAWMAALAPVRQAMEARVGKDLISAILKETAGLSSN
ncbi:TRAP transporter substrate-binding protein [Elstera sp.]|uniref:TRAP transporter substrate-binding protein n=1 Tax=Elstera sp. TaxID=1916664 RepID=UPI0037C0E303